GVNSVYRTGIEAVTPDPPTYLILLPTALVFVVAMSILSRQGYRVVVDGIYLALSNEALIAELKRRSRERAGRLQHLLDHAGVVTIIAEPETAEVVDISKNAKALIDLPPDQIIGQRLIGTLDLPPFGTLATWNELVARARHGDITIAATIQHPEDNLDRVRHIELTTTVEDVTGTDYALIVLKDVTEQRNLETQLTQTHLLAALGTLSTGVAHEISNPLSGVLINLRLAQSYWDDPNQTAASEQDSMSDILQDAVFGAERIHETVTNLLATTQPSVSKAAECDPKRVVDMLLRIANTEIRHRAEVNLEAAWTPLVQADPLRLYQILLPLILQATQTISEGEAGRHRITVRLGYDEDAQRVAIEIEDTGDGLSREQTHRVFEPDFSTRPTGRGAGLGLSVCKNLVTELGGTIRVDSTVGRGSRFVVSLPAVAPKQPAQPAPSRAVVRDYRILVVDDIDLIARALSRQINRMHQATVTTNAHDALQLLQQESFDFVLCDVMMPQMSGIEFYRSLERFDTKLAQKIIFMTGGAFTDSATSFLDEIANPCLNKPFNMDELNAAIAQLSDDQADERRYG
ncbi:MAG: ATP-binding protein, partial [Myxococcota bacterium]